MNNLQAMDGIEPLLPFVFYLPVLNVSKRAELMTKLNGFCQSNLIWALKAIQPKVK